MVNPGSFKGKRKEFLMGEKAAYAAGVEGGYAADAIAIIQRRYFKRFPIDLPHDQDPTQELLDAGNDEEPDPEPEIPREDQLSPEEYQAEVRKLQKRSADIDFRKGQIKRWLVYQHMKDHSPSDTSKNGPYHALLYKLTGIGSTRPRQKTASNIWRRNQRDVIEQEAKKRIEAGGISKSKLASVRQTVATEMFAALSGDKKSYWEQQALDEHEDEVKQWESKLKGPPSTAPRDRQKCILGLTEFMQPILDGVCAATGWKCMFFAGGPEPAHSGRLNVIAVHSGTTKGDIKMNFGRAERQRYKDSVLPVFGSFLRKCYSPEDCRAFALPLSDKVKAVEVERVEKEGGSLDTIPDDVAPGLASKTKLPNASNTPRPAMAASTPPPVATLATSQPQASHPVAIDNTPRPQAAQAAVAPSPCHPTQAFQTTVAIPSNDTQHNTTGAPTLVNPPITLPSNTPSSDATSSTSSTKPTTSDSPGLENLPFARTLDPYTHGVATTPFAHAPSLPPSPCPSRGGSPPCMSPRSVHASMPMSSPLSMTDLVPAAAGMSASTSAFDAVAAVVAAALAECPLPVPRNTDVPSASPTLTPAPVLPFPSSSVTTSSITEKLTLPSAVTGHVPASNSLQSSTTTPSTSPPNHDTPPPPASSTVPEDPANQPSQSQTTQAIISSVTSPAIHSTQLRRPPPTKRKRQTASKENGGPPGEPKAKRLRPDNNIGTTLSRPPLWISKATSQFLKEDLGGQWASFVSCWRKFEEREGYNNPPQLPSFNPPPEVEGWMKHPRLANWRPDIEPQEFAKTFGTWWTSLQPDWRVAQGEVKRDRLDGDWGTLRRSGRHGFAGVVGALFLWGSAARDSEYLSGVWLSALEDCSAALEHL